MKMLFHTRANILQRFSFANLCFSGD